MEMIDEPLLLEAEARKTTCTLTPWLGDWKLKTYLAQETIARGSMPFLRDLIEMYKLEIITAADTAPR
jgi:hypothetical protein